ncbi:VOC family protein [Streptosporangium sp. NPDC004379]|uniref:VOC family protein n=1 Tax=Streptosporangium sp. NPDC004379 TaxID=3366189 RepID=UPI00368C9A65
MKIQISFDANDPSTLAAFWAAAMGYVLQPPPEGFGSWDAWADAQGIPEEGRLDWAAAVDPAGNGPRFYFQRVPEGKTAKNRVHLDISVDGPSGLPIEERRKLVDAEVARFTGLGAEWVRDYAENGEYWVLMRDPEGNEFCLQ